MGPKNMVALLNNALPNQKVIKDAADILREQLEKPLGEFKPDEIPPANARIDVVAKAFVLTNYDHAFGNHYIAEVAIGGIERQAHGVVSPKYFFATLYYSEELRLITVDFHEELR